MVLKSLGLMHPPFAICMNKVKALLKRSEMSQISIAPAVNLPSITRYSPLGRF